MDCPLRVGKELLPQAKEFKYLKVLFTSLEVDPEHAGERDMWNSLLSLLPQGPGPRKADANGWMNSPPSPKGNMTWLLNAHYVYQLVANFVCLLLRCK